jgi:hypothetical protein
VTGKSKAATRLELPVTPTSGQYAYVAWLTN